MTSTLILKTVIEVLAVLLIIIGFIYEKKVIAFENKVVRYFFHLARKHRRRKMVAVRLEQQRLEQQRRRAEAQMSHPGKAKAIKKTSPRVA